MPPAIAKILVPTDFSPSADAAMDYARGLAAKLGASVHLLHVVEDPYIQGPLASEFYVPEPPGIRTEMVKEAGDLLAKRLAPDDRRDLHATWEAVIGHSYKTIVEYAADHGFDLIVMGTHGRTGISRLLMGSVAGHVVRTAPCPVLTVRDAASRATREAAVAEAASIVI
jgi:nucleotide-binding universal stress UspA family protein